MEGGGITAGYITMKDDFRIPGHKHVLKELLYRPFRKMALTLRQHKYLRVRFMVVSRR